VKPDRLISERTCLVVGGTEFVLIPVRGGETPDALMVHLPASGLLFTGDVMMPYLGVPFTAEGSPEGLLETLRYIRELAPRQLIEGHTTLTENFTIEALTGLEPALTELHEFALARIGENMTLPHILDLGYLPALLRDHPAAVVPYLVGRDDFIARLYHQRTGYWQPEARRTHSSPPLPPLPVRATWPSRWKSSLPACSGIPTAASWLSSGKRF
jgi:glyoxylase-like metal-dependent hydrolase (beta-lactamase superfamily II)